jgi:drug/metabolite transporter (DMT)-like permease
MLFTSVILLLIALFSKRFILLDIKKSLYLLAIGAIVSLHWVFFYGSLKYSTISVSLVCFSAVGFFSSFLEPIIFKKKFLLIELILGLVVMFGIYLIFHFDQRYRFGILLGVISSFLAALFPILNKKFIHHLSPDTITLYEMSGGFFMLTLLMPIYLLLPSNASFIPNTSDLFWLMILSLFCTVLAFNLSVRSLQKVSPFTVNLSFNLEPVYGILLAFLIFHENDRLGWPFYIGMLIIASTVIFQSMRVWLSERTAGSISK